MTYDCDVLVIGSGAGGATLAYACARAGKSVLLLERGSHYVVAPDAGARPSFNHGHDERAMLIDKKPYDDRAVEVNGVGKRLYMGGVVGGSTALYGAACSGPAKRTSAPGDPMASASPAPFGTGRFIRGPGPVLHAGRTAVRSERVRR